MEAPISSRTTPHPRPQDGDVITILPLLYCPTFPASTLFEHLRNDNPSHLSKELRGLPRACEQSPPAALLAVSNPRNLFVKQLGRCRQVTVGGAHSSRTTHSGSQTSLPVEIRFVTPACCLNPEPLLDPVRRGVRRHRVGRHCCAPHFAGKYFAKASNSSKRSDRSKTSTSATPAEAPANVIGPNPAPPRTSGQSPGNGLRGPVRKLATPLSKSVASRRCVS